MNKIISSIIGITTIGVLSTPIIYQKQLDKEINKQTNLLATKNIIIKEKDNKDSFFKINREYIITIKDITPLIKEVYPDISIADLRSLKKYADNTQFLINLNLLKYPLNHKKSIIIDLFKLNDNLSKDLKQTQSGKEFLEFIKNKGLEIVLDTNSLRVTKAKLKDINLILHNEKDIATIKLNNAYTIFNDVISTNIDNILFDLKEKKQTTFNIQNISYNLTKQNDFNYKTNTNIKYFEYKYKYKSAYTINNIKLKNISSSSKVNAILNNLNILNTLNISNAIFNADNNYIDINNFTFNTKFEKLNFASIKQILEILQQPNFNQNQLITPIQTLLNNGFNFKIEPLKLNSAKLHILNKDYNISIIDITLNTKLEKNNFKINDSFDVLLNYLLADLNIYTTNENINLLTKLNPASVIYLAMISKPTKDGVNINISYKNGKLISNGKELF